MDTNFNTNNMEGINLDKLDPRVSVSGEKKTIILFVFLS